MKNSIAEHPEILAYDRNYRDIVSHAYHTSEDIPAALKMGEVRGFLELALIVLFAFSPNIEDLSMGLNLWDSMESLHEIMEVGYTPRLKDRQAKLKTYLQRLEKLEIIRENFNVGMSKPAYLDVDWPELSKL